MSLESREYRYTRKRFGDFRLADSSKCDRTEELFRTLHILQEICQGILAIDRPPYRSHQEGSLQLG